MISQGSVSRQPVPSQSHAGIAPLGIWRVLCILVAQSHQPKNLRMNPMQREGCMKLHTCFNRSKLVNRDRGTVQRGCSQDPSHLASVCHVACLHQNFRTPRRKPQVLHSTHSTVVLLRLALWKMPILTYLS